jgi:hypothetical protein
LKVYQRVHYGELYGFIRLIDGTPEQTYACSMTPSVWVAAIGFLDCDEDAYDHSGYYSVGDVSRSLIGEPEEFEGADDAREEFQGNW